jgi:hypothetical protein
MSMSKVKAILGASFVVGGDSLMLRSDNEATRRMQSFVPPRTRLRCNVVFGFPVEYKGKMMVSSKGATAMFDLPDGVTLGNVEAKLTFDPRKVCTNFEAHSDKDNHTYPASGSGITVRCWWRPNSKDIAVETHQLGVVHEQYLEKCVTVPV